MTGEYVFLNSNEYVKDGTRRCFSTFCDLNGSVTSFNSSGFQGVFPDPFSICTLDFQIQQFGRSASFVLENLSVTGKLVSK